MLSFQRPVELKDFEYIWQFPLVKQSQRTGQCFQQPMTVLPRVESSSSPMMLQTGNGPQGQKKRKIDEMRRADGWSLGQSSSSFTWTEGLHNRFLNVLQDLGTLKATPSDIVNRMNAPGLTMRIVAEKLKELCMGIIQHYRSLLVNSNATSAGVSGNANHCLSSTDGEHSPLTYFLENNENRTLLRETVRVAMSRWQAENSCRCRAPPLPPGSILDGLGRAFEHFIDQFYDEAYGSLVPMEAPVALLGVQRVEAPMALPGGPRVQFQYAGPSVVQQAGPSAPSVPQVCGDDISSIFLKLIDGKDMFDGITFLINSRR